MVEGRPLEECSTWRDEVFSYIDEDPPKAIVTAPVSICSLWDGGRELSEADSETTFAAGLERTWTRLRGTGAEVVTMAPAPRFSVDQPERVMQNMDDLDECGEQSATAVERTQASVAAALKDFPWVKVIDLNGLLCPDDFCPAVQDDVLVWGDTNHLTTIRAEQLAEPLGAALEAAIGDSQ